MPLAGHPLTPYVPRVLAEWDLDAPGSAFQVLDASLCFVDISGFTALSERLAAGGRIGAEELTEVLDRVFGNMLRLAHARGGSLLKFGGDALLLLFERGDHATQATDAAVEMRAALREAARIPTSVGRIPLRMSVGLHTGPVDLYRAGSLHRELIVTGATATTTTVMEATADAGEIVISDQLRAELPTGAAGEPKGSGWLLRWRRPRTPAPGPIPRRRVPADTYELGVPVRLRSVLTEHSDPEHRIATVGFVKFKGIGAAQAAGGREGVAAALETLAGTVQDAADNEGVTFLATDIDEDGGKVILTTGVPTTQEDDDGRMLRAVRRIADAAIPFPLKIGVNRGHVFAGEIGTDFRSTYTVMGDTVNLAARFMAAAPPGRVYAAPAVLDRSRTRFEATPLDPMYVKGKSEPVTAYAMGIEAGVRTEAGRRTLPFAGREQEVATIRAAADAGGDALSIIGDTGVGKSRLVAEALAGRRAFTVRAQPSGRNIPYWSWRDPLRRLLGITRKSQRAMGKDLEEAIAELDRSLLDDLPLIGDATHIEIGDSPATAAIDPQFRPARTAAAVLKLLAAANPDGIVVVAEDGHWMDEQSLAIVRRAADVAARREWLVILTARSGTIDDLPGRVIELQPLTTGDSRSIVIAATEAAPLRAADLEVLMARSGGNPLVLDELIRVVRETGTVEDLPDSLDAIVGMEIDALAHLARRVLRMVSVLGRSFRRVVLDEFLAAEGLRLDRATTLALGQFLDEDDGERLSFRHAAVHQVAYEGLSYRRRRLLHARAGAVIERLAGGDPLPVAEFLAHHYSRAGDWEKAWRYAAAAGDRAKRRYANREAAVHYRSAVDAARRLESVDGAEAGRIYEALGDVIELAGAYEDADQSFAAARRLLADRPGATGRLIAKQGLLREKAGKLPQALRWFRRGLNAVTDDSGPEAAARAELRVAYAGIRFRQGRFDDAIAWCRLTLEDQATPEPKRAHALSLLVTAYAHAGIAGAAEAGAEAIEIYRRIGDLVGVANVLNNLGVDAYYRGDWSAATEHWSRSEDARRRAGDVVGAATQVNNLAEIASDQGRLEEARAGFREALYVWESSRFPVGIALAAINLGRALTRLGMLDEARRRLERGLELFSDMGAQAFVLETRLRLAELLLCERRHREALAAAEDLIGECGTDPSTLMVRAGALRVAGYAAAAQGDPGAAADNLRVSLRHAGEADSAYEEALTLQALVRVRAGDGQVPAWETRLGEITGRLDIVAVPAIPLGGELPLPAEVPPARP